jgi:hypothetical protein
MSLFSILAQLVPSRPSVAAPQVPRQNTHRDRPQVKSLDQLARKYGFAEPDEVAGPASAGAYLDYGHPFTISDSARTGRRRTTEERWAAEVHESLKHRD